MRALHVVGVSDDGTQLLLATAPDAGRPSHAVMLDERLRAAVRGELAADARTESALRPKEIQARLRSGESIESVAKAAGVPALRIQRYAGPVLSERELVLDAARRAIPRRDRGVAGQPLGAAVEARLAGLTGLKPDSVEWTAKRRDDGAWVIGLSFSARGGARQAEWLWRPAANELRPLSAAATRLAGTPTAPARPAGRKAAASAGRPVPPRRKPAATKARAARAAGAAGTAPAKPVVVKPRKEPRPAPVTAPTVRNGRVEVPSWSDVLFGAGTLPVPVAAGDGPRPARQPAAKLKVKAKGRSTRRGQG